MSNNAFKAQAQKRSVGSDIVIEDDANSESSTSVKVPQQTASINDEDMVKLMMYDSRLRDCFTGSVQFGDDTAGVTSKSGGTMKSTIVSVSVQDEDGKEKTIQSLQGKQRITVDIHYDADTDVKKHSFAFFGSTEYNAADPEKLLCAW